MNEQNLRLLLQRLHSHAIEVDEVIEQLRELETELLPSARLDHHRSLRTGLPETIFGENKTVAQLIEILQAQLQREQVVLATRIDPEKADVVCGALEKIQYHPEARVLVGNREQIVPLEQSAPILIITAGTSDFPVAEEARIALECFGRRVETIADAGVAGIHRILAHQHRLREAPAIIVVAGMEGALPSVVAGMTPAPVIGVPTSIGYGTGTGGFAALLGMLNSCAPGLAVVNIDNGFGAACMAAAIVRD